MIIVELTGSGSAFLSRLRLSSAATLPPASCTGTTDLTTPTRAPPIRTSLPLTSALRVGHPRLEVVGGDEGQAVVGVVGEEDGDQITTSTVTAPTSTGLLATPCMPLRFSWPQEVVEEGALAWAPAAVAPRRRACAGLRLQAGRFRRESGSARGDGGGWDRPDGASGAAAAPGRFFFGSARRAAALRRSAEAARLEPVKLAEQPLFGVGHVFEAVRSASTRLRMKWPYLSNSLVAAVAVVDQVDEAVEALGLPWC